MRGQGVKMEADGLIRRKMSIVLTDKARALRGDFDRISQEMNELYYQGFTDEEIAVFEGYLARMLHNVEGGTTYEQGILSDHQ